MRPTDLWRPCDREFIANPYPIYEKIRKIAPVFQADTGDYVVLGYKEVKTVLHDRDCLSGVRADWISKLSNYAGRRAADFGSIEKAVKGMLIQLNPPEHTTIRSLLAKNWPTREEVTELAGRISEKLFVNLPSGQVDMVSEVTRKLPLQLICRILGVPDRDGEDMMTDGFQLVQLLDPYLTIRDLEKIEQSATRLMTYFHDHIDADSDSQLTESIQKFVTETGEKDQGVALLLFLFIAGFETTATLLTTASKILLEDRGWEDQLSEVESIERFVSEVIRIHSPVQLTGRVASHPIVLSGMEIPEGSVLTLCLGAANRDPNYFERPDQIDINRNKSDHLSFGYGMHHCLGSQLAQVEAAAVIKKLLNRMDSLSLQYLAAIPEKLTIRSVNHLYVQNK